MLKPSYDAEIRPIQKGMKGKQRTHRERGIEAPSESEPYRCHDWREKVELPKNDVDHVEIMPVGDWNLCHYDGSIYY